MQTFEVSSKIAITNSNDFYTHKKQFNVRKIYYRESSP